jgi:hypothetical protein
MDGNLYTPFERVPLAEGLRALATGDNRVVPPPQGASDLSGPFPLGEAFEPSGRNPEKYPTLVYSTRCLVILKGNKIFIKIYRKIS